jgi:hypothetical protein
MSDEQRELDYRRRFFKLIDRMGKAVDRAVEEDRIAAYFRALSHFSITDLELAVDTLIRECRSNADGFRNLPSVADIIDEITSRKQAKNSNLIPYWCEMCHQSGFVLAYTSRHPGGVAYRCSCKNGDQRDHNIKTWEAVKHLFEPPADYRPEKLPLTSPMELGTMDPDTVFPNGVEVGFICDTCNKPDIMRYERRIEAQELIQRYVLKSRPFECQHCFIERGVRNGMWQI